MLARGFIEIKAVGFRQTQFVAIEHIIRIKWSTTGTNNQPCGELWLNGSAGASESNRLKTNETPTELMILINKERELIRAMEKAAG